MYNVNAKISIDTWVQSKVQARGVCIADRWTRIAESVNRSIAISAEHTLIESHCERHSVWKRW